MLLSSKTEFLRNEDIVQSMNKILMNVTVNLVRINNVFMIKE